MTLGLEFLLEMKCTKKKEKEIYSPKRIKYYFSEQHDCFAEKQSQAFLNMKSMLVFECKANTGNILFSEVIYPYQINKVSISSSRLKTRVSQRS